MKFIKLKKDKKTPILIQKSDYSNLDVIVLTYNRAEWLKIMLDSLCTQTAIGFNIKVLNNASTDNTVNVVEEMHKKYPDRNITCITNEKNLGNFGNFCRSQEIAENEYTAIFHDDDAVNPEYIETAMKILNDNKNVIMCSGGAKGLFNVENTNWDILYKDYYLYPKNLGVYLQLLIQRPTFAVNIYKTEHYKNTKYKYNRYGKLHDVLFMMEMNLKGDVAFILGDCLRRRQSLSSDSYIFTNGPFPNEIANIINDIWLLDKPKHYLMKPLLWNFAYFLYKWAVLKNYETWSDFKKRLDTRNGGIFLTTELKDFNDLEIIESFNNQITYEADRFRKKILNKFPSRF